MRRKKKTKPKKKRMPFLNPSISWLPAFFGGLCVGISIHLIPGMGALIEKARQQQEIVVNREPEGRS